MRSLPRPMRCAHSCELGSVNFAKRGPTRRSRRDSAIPSGVSVPQRCSMRSIPSGIMRLTGCDRWAVHRPRRATISTRCCWRRLRLRWQLQRCRRALRRGSRARPFSDRRCCAISRASVWLRQTSARPRHDRPRDDSAYPATEAEVRDDLRGVFPVIRFVCDQRLRCGHVTANFVAASSCRATSQQRTDGRAVAD